MSVKRRVIEVLENKGVNKEKFFSDIGVSSGNFRGKALESSLSSDVLAKILAMIPEVNANWILTGYGEKFYQKPVDDPDILLNKSNKTEKLYQELLEVKDQENKILREMLSEYQKAPKRQA
nr:hypothetical protein [uncultured Fluviicola sp.]